MKVLFRNVWWRRCFLLFALLTCSILGLWHSVPFAAGSMLSLSGENLKVWDFEEAFELADWDLVDKSTTDGGTYLWAEETYTFTHGVRSVWPGGNVVTATAAAEYPDNLDTWMVYSWVIPTASIGWNLSLVFDWWLDTASGDVLAVLTSHDGETFTPIWSRSAQGGGWHRDEQVSLDTVTHQGRYYIAFRFTSDADGQSGQGAFVDYVRLRGQITHYAYLPLICRRWPPLPDAPVLQDVDKIPEADTYTVAWLSPVWGSPIISYTLQESTTLDFGASIDYTSALTSHLIEGQPPDQYYYRVRAHNEWGFGPWSNVISVSVVLPLPEAPVLQEIDKVPEADSYNIVWYPPVSSPPVFSYTLQESTLLDFSESVDYTSVLTSYTVTGQPMGQYYYRVRGHNSSGFGPWSNVVSTSVVFPSFWDNFDNPTTGWTVRRTSSPDLSLMRSYYSGGYLITSVEDKFDFGIFSPMSEAPEPPYEIGLGTRIVNQANLVSYGIAFGANGGGVCSIDRDLAGNPGGCFYHYYRLNFVWGGDYLKYGVKRIDYHRGGEDGRGKGFGLDLVPYRRLEDWKAHPNSFNSWRVLVYEDGFSVYVNGSLLGWTSDYHYTSEPFWGIFSSTDEYNISRWEHDYFYVVPISSGAAAQSLPSPDEGYCLPDTNWCVPLEDAHLYMMD